MIPLKRLHDEPSVALRDALCRRHSRSRYFTRILLPNFSRKGSYVQMVEKR